MDFVVVVISKILEYLGNFLQEGDVLMCSRSALVLEHMDAKNITTPRQIWG